MLGSSHKGEVRRGLPYNTQQTEINIIIIISRNFCTKSF